MSNQINPKKLLHSKWTKRQVENRRKHFIVVAVKYDELGKVSDCQIQAVLDTEPQGIDWRQLRDSSCWQMGWK
ncbi:TIGR02450 family Trp-rich protein [Thalassotalea mangrovi]|uniref:TIGR02450 family Trp-rich protein n=1 Tax=Thalassotalea mangrovi TaxID=2572245 RepID=A0A4V5NUJ6_9GAMM|nr:TIGR02450 family Trp-rich protein [Thalassotalea mangrovi]TKB45699.1 TIGR02450 family Trp-rich protein [Thalassotalea mangrovi]